MRGFLLALALGCAAVPAIAQEDTQVIVNTGAAGGGGSYTGPGNIGLTYTAFWGLRAYSQAIVTAGVQALVNLQRTSDSHTCDIIVNGSGGLGNTANCSTGGDNGTAVATWCNATTCKADKLYEQLGSGRDLVQATVANQPTLTLSCLGALPCLSATSSSITMVTATTFTPATGQATLVVVADRVSGTAGALINQAVAANRFLAAGANTWQTKVAAGTTVSGTASDNAWHVGQGIIKTAGGTITNIDNTQTSGTANGNTTAGVSGFVGGASSTIRWAELGFIDNVQATTGQQTSICSNAFNYWGTSTSC